MLYTTNKGTRVGCGHVFGDFLVFESAKGLKRITHRRELASRACFFVVLVL